MRRSNKMTDEISKEGREATDKILRLLRELPIYESIAILDTVKFSIQITAWENTGK